MMMAQPGRTIRAAIFVIVASTSFSHALDIEKCAESREAVMNWPHGIVGDYENLGHSLVLYKESASYDGQGSQTVILSHCRSGETLTIWGDVSGRFSQDYNGSDAVVTLLKQFVASSQSYSFPAISIELNTLGLEAELATIGEEICPCKAFYPQDRLKKVPYIYESGFVK
jgi:hypothetical protein